MAANALPPHAVIQALAALIVPIGSGVSKFFDREHRVNAFWNHILRLYNPGIIATAVPPEGGPAGLTPSPSTFIISAEIYSRATDTSGNRADLAVSDVVLTTDGTAAAPTQQTHILRIDSRQQSHPRPTNTHPPIAPHLHNPAPYPP